MKDKTRIGNCDQITITNFGWLINSAELYDALMVFSRKPRNSVKLFTEEKKLCPSFETLLTLEDELELFCQDLGIKKSQVISCNQVHGDKIIICDKAPKKLIDADAIIATSPGLYPSVRTADCVPILLLDKSKKISAAIHAGWRGTMLKIVRKTLVKFGELFQSNMEDILVGLGPCIGKCCYEVDNVVLDPMFKIFPWATKFAFESQNVSNPSEERRRLDLLEINKSEIINFGIPSRNIFSVGLCTCCNESYLHSYRRDGESSGRSIAITGFKS